MLVVVCRSLFAVVRLRVACFVNCLLAGVCGLLFASNRCDLCVGACCLCCLLFVGSCSWRGVCCVLFVACCVWCVVDGCC